MKKKWNQMVILADETESYLALKKFNSDKIFVEIREGLNFQNAIDFIQESKFFKKGTLFIICAGIFSLVNLEKNSRCIQVGCLDPYLVLEPISQRPNIIELAKLLLHNVTTQASNDNLIFSEIIPILIKETNKTFMRNSRCNHPLPPPLVLMMLNEVDHFNDWVKNYANKNHPVIFDNAINVETRKLKNYSSHFVNGFILPSLRNKRINFIHSIYNYLVNELDYSTFTILKKNYVEFDHGNEANALQYGKEANALQYRKNNKSSRFEHIVIVASLAYRDLLIKYECEQVSLYTPEVLKLSNLSEVISSDIAKFKNQSTLWLFVSGIFSVIDTYNHLECVYFCCKHPFYKIDEKSECFNPFKFNEIINDLIVDASKIEHNFLSLLNDSSSFVVMPLIPAQVINCSNVLHDDLHIIPNHLNSVVIADESTLYNLYPLYNQLSSRFLGLTGLGLEKQNLSEDCLLTFIEDAKNIFVEEIIPFNNTSTLVLKKWYQFMDKILEDNLLPNYYSTNLVHNSAAPAFTAGNRKSKTNLFDQVVAIGSRNFLDIPRAKFSKNISYIEENLVDIPNDRWNTFCSSMDQYPSNSMFIIFVDITLIAKEKHGSNYDLEGHSCYSLKCDRELLIELGNKYFDQLIELNINEFKEKLSFLRKNVPQSSVVIVMPIYPAVGIWVNPKYKKLTHLQPVLSKNQATLLLFGRYTNWTYALAVLKKKWNEFLYIQTLQKENFFEQLVLEFGMSQKHIVTVFSTPSKLLQYNDLGPKVWSSFLENIYGKFIDSHTEILTPDYPLHIKDLRSILEAKKKVSIENITNKNEKFGEKEKRMQNVSFAIKKHEIKTLHEVINNPNVAPYKENNLLNKIVTIDKSTKIGIIQENYINREPSNQKKNTLLNFNQSHSKLKMFAEQMSNLYLDGYIFNVPKIIPSIICRKKFEINLCLPAHKSLLNLFMYSRICSIISKVILPSIYDSTVLSRLHLDNVFETLIKSTGSYLKQSLYNESMYAIFLKRMLCTLFLRRKMNGHFGVGSLTNEQFSAENIFVKDEHKFIPEKNNSNVEYGIFVQTAFKDKKRRIKFDPRYNPFSKRLCLEKHNEQENCGIGLSLGLVRNDGKCDFLNKRPLGVSQQMMSLKTELPTNIPARENDSGLDDFCDVVYKVRSSDDVSKIENDILQCDMKPPKSIRKTCHDQDSLYRYFNFTLDEKPLCVSTSSSKLQFGNDFDEGTYFSIKISSVNQILSAKFIQNISIACGTTNKPLPVLDGFILSVTSHNTVGSLIRVLDGRRIYDSFLKLILTSGTLNYIPNQENNYGLDQSLCQVVEDYETNLMHKVQTKYLKGVDISSFKTMPCPRIFCPDKILCINYHCEKDRRRPICPHSIEYSSALCQDIDIRGSCQNGVECFLAHNTNEVAYHPYIYKTLMCPSKNSCQRENICPKIHPENSDCLFNRCFQNVICEGLDKSLDYLVSAIRLLYKVEEKHGIQVLFVSPSQDFIRFCTNIISPIAEINIVNVTSLSENGFDIISLGKTNVLLGTPSSIMSAKCKSGIKIFNHLKVLIIDDMTKVLSDVHFLGLLETIRSFRSLKCSLNQVVIIQDITSDICSRVSKVLQTKFLMVHKKSEFSKSKKSSPDGFNGKILTSSAYQAPLKAAEKCYRGTKTTGISRGQVNKLSTPGRASCLSLEKRNINIESSKGCLRELVNLTEVSKKILEARRQKSRLMSKGSETQFPTSKNKNISTKMFSQQFVQQSMLPNLKEKKKIVYSEPNIDRFNKCPKITFCQKLQKSLKSTSPESKEKFESNIIADKSAVNSSIPVSKDVANTIDKLLHEARKSSSASLIEPWNKTISFQSSKEDNVLEKNEDIINRLHEEHKKLHSSLIQNPQTDPDFERKYKIFVRKFNGKRKNYHLKSKSFKSTWNKFWKFHIDDKMEREWSNKLLYLETKFLSSVDNKTKSSEFQKNSSNLSSSKENFLCSPPLHFSYNYPPTYLLAKSTPYFSNYSRGAARNKIEKNMVSHSGSFKRFSDTLNASNSEQCKEYGKNAVDNYICNFKSVIGADEPMKDIAMDNSIYDFISDASGMSSPKLRRGCEKISIDKHTSNSRIVMEVDALINNDVTVESLSDESIKLSSKGCIFGGLVQDHIKISQLNDMNSRLNITPVDSVVFKPELIDISPEALSDPEIDDLDKEYLYESHSPVDMVIAESDLSDTGEENEVTQVSRIETLGTIYKNNRPVTKSPSIVNTENNQRNSSETPSMDKTDNIKDNSALTAEHIIADDLIIVTTSSFLGDPISLLPGPVPNEVNYSPIGLFNNCPTKVETNKTNDPIMKNINCLAMSSNAQTAVSSTKSEVDNSEKNVPKLSPELIMQVKGKYKRQQLSNSKKNISSHSCFGSDRTPLKDEKDIYDSDSTINEVTEFNITATNKRSSSNEVNQLYSKEEMLKTLAECSNSSKLPTLVERRQTKSKRTLFTGTRTIKEHSMEVQLNYPRFSGDRTPLRDENDDAKYDTPVSSETKCDSMTALPSTAENDTTLPFAIENDKTIPFSSGNDFTISSTPNNDKTIPFSPNNDLTISFTPKNDTTIPFTPENDITIPFTPKNNITIPFTPKNDATKDSDFDNDITLLFIAENDETLPFTSKAEDTLPIVTVKDYAFQFTSGNDIANKAIPKDSALKKDEVSNLNLEFELKIALINLNAIMLKFPSLKLGFDFIVKSFDDKLDTKENLTRSFKDEDNKLLFLIANDLINDIWQHSKDDEHLEALKYCRLILRSAVEDFTECDF